MKKVKQIIWAAMGFVATLLAAVCGWGKGTGQSACAIVTARSGAMPPALNNAASRQHFDYTPWVKRKPSVAKTQWIGYALSTKHLPAAPPGRRLATYR